MQVRNTILEDINAEIGYTAAATLCGWFGGKIIRVPLEARENHPIALVIGAPAFVRLVRSFGGQRIFIPVDTIQATIRRHRAVYDLLKSGANTLEVSEKVGLSRMQICNIRRQLEETGLLPMILSPDNYEENDEIEVPA